MIKDIRVGFTGGDTAIDWMIQRLDYAQLRDGTRTRSKINHVLLRIIYFNGPDLVFQSFGKYGVHICWFSALENAYKEGRLLRYTEKTLDLTIDQKNQIIQRVMSLNGLGYDFILIALYYMWIRLGGDSTRSKWILRLNGKNRMTCNEFVLHSICGISPAFPGDPDLSFRPERIFHKLMGMSSPEFWDNDLRPDFDDLEQPFCFRGYSKK